MKQLTNFISLFIALCCAINSLGQCDLTYTTSDESEYFSGFIGIPLEDALADENQLLAAAELGYPVEITDAGITHEFTLVTVLFGGYNLVPNTAYLALWSTEFNNDFLLYDAFGYGLGSGVEIVIPGAYDSDLDGICDAEEIAGCMDTAACNFLENATDDSGECIYPEPNQPCGSEACDYLLSVQFDGHDYPLVAIGDQCWFQENLQNTHYANGDNIPLQIQPIVNSNLIVGARSVFDNNEANAEPYGRRYNYTAVVDHRGLCPTGWHPATLNEWNALFDFYGGPSLAAPALFDESFSSAANNESGLSLSSAGEFLNGGISNGQTTWWTSTRNYGPKGCRIKGWMLEAGCNDYQRTHRSVRCIKGDFPEVLGCTDPEACNFNPNADATAAAELEGEYGYAAIEPPCFYPDACGSCEYDYQQVGSNNQFCECGEEVDACGVCGGDGSSCVSGCTDEAACNFAPEATTNSGCEYSDVCGNCPGNGLDLTTEVLPAENGDNWMFNYIAVDADWAQTHLTELNRAGTRNARAVLTMPDGQSLVLELDFLDCDGNCNYSGYMVGKQKLYLKMPGAPTYELILMDYFDGGLEGGSTLVIQDVYCDCDLSIPDPFRNCDGSCAEDEDGDGICDQNEIAGCLDEAACNFNAEATDDSGDCIFAEPGEPCGGAACDYLLRVNFDGYEYPLVAIGDQCWFTENLQNTHYANGDDIPVQIQPIVNSNLEMGARSVFDNNEANVAEYGRRYNWNAVVDHRKLCPSGWHPSTLDDWYTLFDHFGGTATAAPVLFDENFNSASNNESGLGLEAAGAFLSGGSSNAQATWWTSTSNSGPKACRIKGWMLEAGCNDYRRTHRSVRCVKGEFPEVIGCTDPLACNFNPAANAEAAAWEVDYGIAVMEQLCYYPDACGNCDFDYQNVAANNQFCGCEEPVDACGVCGGDGSTCITGCTDANACNFNPDATADDGTCETPDACGNCPGDGLDLETVILANEGDGNWPFNYVAVDSAWAQEHLLELNRAGSRNAQAILTAPNGQGLLLELDFLDCNGNCDYTGFMVGKQKLFMKMPGQPTHELILGDYFEGGLPGGSTVRIVDVFCDCDLSIPDMFRNCDGTCAEDTDGDGVCDLEEVAGCMSPTACNFNTNATDDSGDCIHAAEGQPCGSPACDYLVSVTYDGHEYPLVPIGDQCWFQESLQNTHYANGDEIPVQIQPIVASNLKVGARSVFDNNEANASMYGRRYNWNAVIDYRGLCPSGWHPATLNEWYALLDAFGGPNAAGPAIKAVGPWSNATNESGFSLLPGGEYQEGGLQLHGVSLWTGTSTSGPKACRISIGNSDTMVHPGCNNYRRDHRSVRCIKGDFPSVIGCTDPLACNFNPEANASAAEEYLESYGAASMTDLCYYPNACGNCDFDYQNVGSNNQFCGCDEAVDACGICGGDGTSCVPGCTDEAACNFDPEATLDDGTCEIDNAGPMVETTDISLDIGADGMATIPVEAVVLSAIDLCSGSVSTSLSPMQVDCNQVGSDVAVTILSSDGQGNMTIASATVSVLDPNNHCPASNVVLGCTYAEATNYLDTANQDDGSCTFEGTGGNGSTCPDLNGDNVVGTVDLLMLLAGYGEPCDE